MRGTDFKTTASKPKGQDLFERLDLQRLAMTHGVTSITGEPVVGWRWGHLVRTVKPQVIYDPWEARVEDWERERDLLRAIAIASRPQMRPVEEGQAISVPAYPGLETTPPPR